MNILFLTIAYPENKNEKNIYTDLMQEFQQNGHNVYVVTSRERRFNKTTELSKENNINVLRVKTGNVQKTNAIEKGISTIFIETQFKKAIKQFLSDKKFDLVIYSTPPITFEKVIKYIKKRDKCKTYLLLKDIFPQNAVDINMIRENGVIHKYFRRKETNLYKVSDIIGCMSGANLKYILKHNKYLEQTQVEICPNSIKPVDKEACFEVDKIKEKYNIPKDRITFIYGGNLGKPQGIDFLIEVIEFNKNREDIFFIIIGDGTEYTKLDEFLKNNNLTNVKLYKALPKNQYDEVVKVCDVGMIFLDKRFTIPNFPSRLLTYMEYKLPIIAATDENTDLGDVIQNGRFGFWSLSGDIDSFNNNINILVENKKNLKEIGIKGYEYLKGNYTTKISYDIIMNHLKGETENV